MLADAPRFSNHPRYWLAHQRDYCKSTALTAQLFWALFMQSQSPDIISEEMTVLGHRDQTIQKVERNPALAA